MQVLQPKYTFKAVTKDCSRKVPPIPTFTFNNHIKYPTFTDSRDWMTPRGSISSVVSAAYTNFVYNDDCESVDDKENGDEVCFYLNLSISSCCIQSYVQYLITLFYGSILSTYIDTKSIRVCFPQEVKAISDWDLLKLNSPEWIYITVGSIAAFIQGACFPVFAMLFGYTSGVSLHRSNNWVTCTQTLDNFLYRFQIFVLADHNEMLYLADLYSGLFVVVAAVAGISMCLQSTTFTSAGLKMTTRLRHQYFSALLRQVMYFKLY